MMVQSKLKNRFNKKKTTENWNNYKNQRNFCVKLLRKTKKDYFNSLNVKILAKTFLKTIKPYFSNKPGFHKSCTCVRDTLKVMSFTNRRTSCCPQT